LRIEARVKNLVWVGICIVLAAAAAVPILRAATGRGHEREVLTAGVIVLIAAELSLVPLLLSRRSKMLVVFQAALVGTVIHLFLTFAMGAAAFAMRIIEDRYFFLFVLMGLYWISLIFLVTVMTRAGRRAEPENGPSPAAAATSPRAPGAP
jgi:hypothetical protein